MISGKRPSAGVGAVFSGREADYQQLRSGIAKGRYRPAVVLGVFTLHGPQETRQSVAARAIGIEDRFSFRHIPINPSGKFRLRQEGHLPDLRDTTRIARLPISGRS